MYVFLYTQNPSTGLVPDQEDALLMFSTLDGSLIAVEQRTGEIRWHQNDGNYKNTCFPFDFLILDNVTCYLCCF